MSVTTPFGGGSVGSAIAPTGSAGFKDAGMQMMVEEWLDRCFAGSGGIVCLIDNLEILRTSGQAREAVEALRDRLFAKRGLRWVLSGTPAVIGGGALFSARMEGRIAPPIGISPVEAAFAPELVTRRLKRFGSSDAYAPVDGRGFERIYAVVNSRLRSALELCQEFAIFLYAERRRPDASKRLEVLDLWLAARANQHASAASGVPARSWRLFEDLTAFGGEIQGHEAKLLRFTSPDQLAAAALSLCRAGLLERTEVDDGDYVLEVTTPGWLVGFQRNNYTVGGGTRASGFLVQG